MARIRKIPKKLHKDRKNYFLVDACFVAEKYLPIGTATTREIKDRIRECKKWWKKIDRQVAEERARVYIPDVCIAESFKVLAKKYYQESAFDKYQDYKKAKGNLSNDITILTKELKKRDRYIKYHDLPTTRDVVIAVDRFYELFMKNNHNVDISDLILIANAKYLIDFRDAQKNQIHLITFDKALRDGTKKINELPNAYYPGEGTDVFATVFK